MILIVLILLSFNNLNDFFNIKNWFFILFQINYASKSVPKILLIFLLFISVQKKRGCLNAQPLLFYTTKKLTVRKLSFQKHNIFLKTIQI